MTIKLCYDPPPIPSRSHDWTAWIDGEEETGPCGYGNSKVSAFRDFLNFLVMIGMLDDNWFMARLIKEGLTVVVEGKP